MLPEPWKPAQWPGTVEELFASRFRLAADARPYPVQLAVCDVAAAVGEPGLVVVEAPMGEGKTEAALAAAEILASRCGAGGVLVALPTQATCDAMFERVVGWLDAMGASGQQVGGAVSLGHGRAHLNRLFQGLQAAGPVVGIACDQPGADHAVVAHSWLAGRKKGVLANFVVATIDQLLFAGLKSRHLMLRHLGLAGKVVIVDEVHACDAFMGSYLTRVLTWLGAYGVPVVVLSATLPAVRRQALVEAYQQGRTSAGEAPTAAAAAGPVGYPAVTWTDGPAVHSETVAAAPGRGISVHLEALGEEPAELVALLRNALVDGGTALVVRNTVGRVLEDLRRGDGQGASAVAALYSPVEEGSQAGAAVFGVLGVPGVDVDLAAGREGAVALADPLQEGGRVLDLFGGAASDAGCDVTPLGAGP